MQLARRHQPSSLPEPLRWAIVFVVVCALVAILTCSAASADDTSTEEAIASTSVQELAGQPDAYEMSEQAVFNMYEPPQPNFLADYARTADGQWHIPQHVDPTNPGVRLLILGPARPTLVDVTIYVDGEPYTAAREKLIDGLMNRSTLEALVREAVKVPVPEDAMVGADEAEEETAPKPADVKKESATDPSTQVSEERAQETVSTEDSTDDAEAKTAAAEPESREPEKPVVDAQRRAARTVAQRLVNYMASADVKADREEIRWLMAEWTGGPALLTLGPAMSWQRVSFAPLWNVLDADKDGSLDSAEVAAASERLAQADVDENSIVELTEMLSLQPSRATSPHSYPLMVVIDPETDWQQLNSHLQAAYGRRMAEVQGPKPSATSALLDRIAQGDPTVSLDELRSLVNEDADIRLRLSLGGTDKKNRLALLAADDAVHSANENMVTVVRGAEYFEFSAGEVPGIASSDPTATQVAIGAAIDGYPLFRIVDRNGDRRLSPRECRNLKNVLAELDLDGNGAIDSHERPTALRVVITRGPHVHEMLAEPSSAAREFAGTGKARSAHPSDAESAAKVPAWFADMDRNRDGDLSRTEFLGTSEQFKELDRDQDGLIGSQEAGK